MPNGELRGGPWVTAAGRQKADAIAASACAWAHAGLAGRLHAHCRRCAAALRCGVAPTAPVTSLALAWAMRSILRHHRHTHTPNRARQRDRFIGTRPRSPCCPWLAQSASPRTHALCAPAGEAPRPQLVSAAVPARSPPDDRFPAPKHPQSLPAFCYHRRSHALPHGPLRRPDQCRLHVTALERPKKYLTHPIGEVKCHARSGPRRCPSAAALSAPSR